MLSWQSFSADGVDIPADGVDIPADGVDIPADVATARALLARYGADYAECCEISINEMVPPGSNFDPGVHVAYFANLERAAVDSACHSCWPSSCPSRAVLPCFNCGQSDR